MLKRKNEDSLLEDPLTKRVAIDSEILEAEDAQKDKTLTAPFFGEGQEPAFEKLAEPELENDNLPKRATPISSHKVHDDDPTYVHFRMLVTVKEAGLIVGKGGEKINYIKDKAGARINVSENIKGIYERVVHVRGPAEKDAKAFGLITRAIIDEPETPSRPESKRYVLNLLIPHPVIGFVIGKGGTKFREIEEKSAAKLKASESTLPFSTDRCLSITGVPDAIHIATYYVGQTIYENKKMHKGKVIFYNPGNSSNQPQGFGGPQFPGAPLGVGQGFQFTGFNNGYNQPQMMGMMPMQMYPMGANGRNNRNIKPYAVGGPYKSSFTLQSDPQPNNISMTQGQAPVGTILPPANFVPGQHQEPPITQEIYIPNEHVGLVIGRRGNNIREIRDNSGSQVKIEDPDPINTHERKIVLTGGATNNQMAMYMINGRVEMDKHKSSNTNDAQVV